MVASLVVTQTLVANEITAAMMYADFARIKNNAEDSIAQSNNDVHQSVAEVLIRGPRSRYMMKYAVKDLLLEGFQGPDPIDFFDANYDTHVWGFAVAPSDNDVDLIVRRLTETGLLAAIISDWDALEV